MAALVTVVRHANTGAPAFAVVADESTARYLWVDDENPWWPDDNARLTEFVERFDARPSTPREWLDLALYHLGEVRWDEPRPIEDMDTGLDLAEELLDAEAEVERPVGNLELSSASQAYDEVSTDWEEFGYDDDVDTEAMDTFVLAAIGPIDPEGPNGWILRAMEGKPRPGDENEYVHFTQPATSKQEER